MLNGRSFRGPICLEFSAAERIGLDAIMRSTFLTHSGSEVGVKGFFGLCGFGTNPVPGGFTVDFASIPDTYELGLK